MPESMAALLADYERIKKALDVAEERDGSHASARMPPASPAQLAGLSLPPSYREFLLENDGWANFWGGMWIAGARGKARRYVQARIKEWRPDASKHVIIGADDNGGFLAFGQVTDDEGEREVLDMPRGFVENTWPTFRAFVESQREYRARDLQELTPKKPATTEPAARKPRPRHRA